jgi:hypothetical protein
VKKLLLIVLVLGSSSLFAETVSIRKAKCSLFGNLKVKLSGLHSYGRLGKLTLTSNLPLSTDCDRSLEKFLGSVSRSSSRVSANISTRIIYTQVNDRNNDKNEKRSDRDHCKVQERKTLTVRFHAASSHSFKNFQTKEIGFYRGRCRR